MTIQRLPPDVAAKIAAGEVVERPANAAKELLENCVDAGATEIRVEIKDGGQRLLCVIDDGCGIPSSELPLALERHATSKVRRVEDLEHVQTFGFRGEALYSIAAVSQLTLSSRCQDEDFGVQLRTEGGKVISQSRTGMPAGTVVRVEHLFYNVPARKKYLRRAATETGHIRSMVQKAALAHPDRRFSLVVDGKMVFQSNGSGDPFDVLAKIYSLEEARQMVPIGRSQRSGDTPRPDLPEEIPFMDDVRPSSRSDMRAPVSVSGFVSLPTLTRANRSYIDLFVNRRPIEDRSLAHAVVQAYHTLLPVGRYPVAVLFVEVEPEGIDVNVHPRKTEVRFLNAREVYSAVQKAVRRIIVDNATVPGMALSHTGSSSADMFATDAPAWKPRQPLNVETRPSPQREMDLFVPRPADANQAGAQGARPLSPNTQPAREHAGEVPASTDSAQAVNREPSQSPHRVLPPLRVVGQVGAMYVVAEGPEGVYLIDQHAAHERIMYEQFMAQRADQGIARQGLLEPLTLHVGDERAALVAQHLDELNAVGFSIEPFGGDTFLVRAVPSALSEQDANRLLNDMLQGLSDERNLVGEELEARLVKMVCKRASIKAGQILSDIEMKELVRQLEECQSPRTCPHGRPTMIQLSANELEKAFKRT